MKARERVAFSFVGRTIVGVDWQPFDDGRGETATDPELVLDDGRRICFVVRETDVGEYSIDIVLRVSVAFDACPSARIIRGMIDLSDAQRLALVNVPPGVYRHYNGALYVVLGLARCDDTGDVLVVYRSQQSYDAEIAGEGVMLRVRPIDEWSTRIPTGDGGTVPRFRRVVE